MGRRKEQRESQRRARGALPRASLLAWLLGGCASPNPPPSPPEGPCHGDVLHAADVRLEGIAAGDSHTCALLAPCGALCWGDNFAGQVGVAEPLAVGVPNWVARNLALQDLDLGNAHSCGLAHDGKVWCWGEGEYTELDGTYRQSTAVPITVEGIPDAVSDISSGGFSSCAILVDRSVSCWGNWRSKSGEALTPMRVSGADEVLAMDRHAGTACAIRNDGAALCWGDNLCGQLGDGTIGGDASRDDARPVVGLTGPAVSVAVGGEFACSALSSGEVLCWGEGEHGTLGDGTLSQNRPTPAPVIDLPQAVGLAAGIAHVCAQLADGGVACWGDNTFATEGEDFQPTPLRVKGIDNVVDIAVGAWYTCALTADQEIYCWGENGSHELGLGDGSPFFVDVPTRVDWRAAFP
jgi:alpha-tubulin suppressor-like RCC1 family protein